jgi:hypothetical protein
MITMMHAMRRHIGIASIGFAWEILADDAHSSRGKLTPLPDEVRSRGILYETAIKVSPTVANST